jgi:peptidoglycan/LPS O-acetylase OafA/YrhL
MAGRYQRRDVQGLRAVAVVFVILNHIVGWPVGGLLGVDVFFVLSGYVITGVLLREHSRSGRISLTSFYRRRARRILPAAALVVVATVAASFLVFTAARARSVLADAFWASVFGANWHFAAVGTDYFSAKSAISPLQHYWSLAVEEQFYLIWPALALLVLVLVARIRGWDRRKALRAYGIAVAAAALASFAWGWVESTSNPAFAYFSTFSRGWELAVGAALAVVPLARARLTAAARAAIAWAGVAVLGVGFIFVTGQHLFPVPLALVAVVGTTSIIAAGASDRALLPLTNRFVVYLGDISYSLYLWHLPVFVLLGAVLPGPFTPAVAMAATALFAVLSYHFVEQPVRRSQWLESGRRLTTLVPAVAAAILVVVSVVVINIPAPHEIVARAARTVVTPAAASELRSELAAALNLTAWPTTLTPTLDEAENAKVPEWTKDDCIVVSAGNADHCTYGQPTATHVAVVYGDSLALSWMPAIRGVLQAQGWRIHVLVRAECPIADLSVHSWDGSPLPGCDSFHRWALAQIAALKPDLTIMSDSIDLLGRLADGATGVTAKEEVSTSLTDTLRRVSSTSTNSLVLAAPPDGVHIAACATRLNSPKDCQGGLSTNWLDMQKVEKSAAKATRVRYFDTVNWFCIAGVCPVIAGDLIIRSDTVHVTGAFSSRLTPLMAIALKPSE